MVVLSNVALFYTLGGVVATLLSLNRPFCFAARVVVFALWPYMFYIERTPKMEAFIKWAEEK